MNLYLRLLIAILKGHFGPRTSVKESATHIFHVMPHDIDAFGHMNNGRYLQIMDVARAAWMAQAGVLSVMWKHRWGATLGGTSVRFRHSLKPFQRFQVTTRLMGFDDRWFYLEHAFVSSIGLTVAVGVSRAALRSSAGWASTKTVMASVDPEHISAPIPDYVKAIYQAEISMFDAFEGSGQAVCCGSFDENDGSAKATSDLKQVVNQ